MVSEIRTFDKGFHRHLSFLYLELYLRSGQILITTDVISCHCAAKFLIDILQSHELSFTNVRDTTLVLHWRLFVMNTNPLLNQFVAAKC
jgi:hypothetical protein